MDKTSKKEIKKLKKEKKYDEIFEKYGTKAYIKNSPKKYRKKEIKELKKNGRYEDVYRKYGEVQYNKVLNSAKYNEIKSEKGNISAILWITQMKFRNILKKIGIITTVSLAANSITISSAIENIVDENAEKYEAEIEAYNEKINDYAKEVNSLNLSDIQIFMKVMDDMWKNIQGYKTPEKDIFGFAELDLANEDGYGVCRNMASDVAKKLDAINPKYNARTMCVYMGNDGKYEFADINRIDLTQSNETVSENNNQEENSDFLSDFTTKFVGNHMVTLVDLEKENVTLVLDPTNPGIGVYCNGNIIMFNNDEKAGIEYESNEISSAIMLGDGPRGIIERAEDYISSYGIKKLSMKDLKNKYGIEAQNKALNEVRALDIAQSVLEEKSDNEFDNKYKISEDLQKRIDEVLLKYRQDTNNLFDKDNEIGGGEK